MERVRSPRRARWALALGLACALMAGAAEDAAFGQSLSLRDRSALFNWPGADDPDVSADARAWDIATDRPDFTEAAATVGRGWTQIETGYTYFHDESGGATFRAHSTPEVLLRVGLFANWFEARVGYNHLWEKERTATATTRVDGSTDLYLGAKFKLFEQDGWRPALVVLPQMLVPTGGSDITNQDLSPGCNILYAWDLNDTYSLAGSTQFASNVNGDAQSFTIWATSISLARSWTDTLSSFHEWFALVPTNDGNTSSGTEHYFDTGFQWIPTPDWAFDVRVGVGLNEVSTNLFTGVGAVKRF